MPDSLHSEILAPTHSLVTRLLLGAVGCGAIAAAFALSSTTEHVTVIAPEVREEMRTEALVAMEPAQPVRSSELSLVFSADGATYVKLADLDAADLPAHGPPRLVSGDFETAIAAVKTRDLPAEHHAWIDRRVRVDGACEATVTGFAVVSRLVGDTGYAGVTDEHWTATSVLDLGSTVLAARLDGCNGTFARDAALPAVLVPAQLENAKLATRARELLLASAPARNAQREWLELEQTGAWHESEDATIKTIVVRHPTTGVTWVSAHGVVFQGCGGPEINVWGLFRVQPDGTLAAAQLRDLGELWSIDQLIDIDGDGELEIVGKPWLGLDTVVTRASGEELERLALAFFGCAC